MSVYLKKIFQRVYKVFIWRNVGPAGGWSYLRKKMILLGGSPFYSSQLQLLFLGLPRVALACDKALQGAPEAEQEKEGGLEPTSLWNLNICIETLGAKCWLAEMTVMRSITFARVFQCLSRFAVVSASLWLADIWKLSRRGATEELEVEFKLQALLPFPALPPERPGELARRLG